MKSAGVTLLENASATGDMHRWPGGRGLFACVGTFGTEKVTLEFLGPDGSTWISVPDVGGTKIELSAAGSEIFELPPCVIRAAVSSGGETPPSGLYAAASRIPV